MSAHAPRLSQLTANVAPHSLSMFLLRMSMRQFIRRSVVALGALLATAMPAHAQFLQEYSRPSNAFGLVWSSISAAPTTTLGGVTATTNGVDWWGPTVVSGVDLEGGFSDGDFLLFGAGNNIMTLDFASPIRAFGTQAWYNVLGGTVQLDAYYLGQLVGSFSQLVGGGLAPNLNQAEVLAFTSGSDVDRVVLTASDEFAINQLGPNATVVPEPASVLLTMAGLAGIGVAARRRRSALADASFSCRRDV